MELILAKTASGHFAPYGTESQEACAKVKMGQMLRGKFTRMRNPQFHRKMMALYQTCYETFSEALGGGIEYRGELVKPSFTRFRHELTILAGHYVPVYNIKGEVKLEAKSISFASCSQEEAEEIFSDLINAALKHVYKERMTEPQLRKFVDDILAFDGG